MRAVLVLGLVAGCGSSDYVVIDGKRVERPSVAYASDYFLDVSDGRLQGRMCNVDVDFDATWYRGRLHLDGRGEEAGRGTRSFHQTDGDFRLEFEVTEVAPGQRHITGKVPGATEYMNTTLDLEIGPQRLVGRIGTRSFDLHADEAYLVGHYERHGDVARPFDVPYAIYGRQILASMVPADQALTLLMMMTCSTTIEYDGKMVRGFSMVSLPPKS